jgi:hypothetical protein
MKDEAMPSNTTANDQGEFKTDLRNPLPPVDRFVGIFSTQA